jgi:hypothetical protein
MLSTKWHQLLPSGAIRDYWKEEQLKYFTYLNSQTRLAKEVNKILGQSHRDKA